MEGKHETEQKIKYIVGMSLMEYDEVKSAPNQKSAHDCVPPTTKEFQRKYLHDHLFKRWVDKTVHSILKAMDQR